MPCNQDALGPSNLFTDLVFYLLTDDMAGAGELLKIDKDNPKACLMKMTL